ncbi:MAG: lysophospholipid acyltransferase family protein [Candidatus Sumerlaeota bacterium]
MRLYKGSSVPWFYRIFQAIFWLCAKIYLRVQFHDNNALPKSGGCLVVSNHASNLDPALVGIPLRRICHFLAKRELFEMPIVGIWMRLVGAIPIQRDRVDRKAMMACTNMLKQGRMIVVFPEGTRTRDGELQKGKAGAAMIAAMAKTTLVPAYIDGSYQAWPRGARFPRPHKVHVWYGNPFHLPDREENQNTKDYYQHCADVMMEKIAELEAKSKASKQS